MEPGQFEDKLSRRRLLKRIGAGAAVAWSAPVLTSFHAPAFAASPACDWSVCVGLCADQTDNGMCQGEPPGQFCMDKCSELCGGHPPHVCTCPAACNTTLWVTDCTFVGVC
jgi:hypothetical protein